MPKIKMPRSSPSLDMTPMVDLAFLLVTFFMLTTQFRAAEPVVVKTPSSISEKVLPDNVMLLSIDKSGKTFYNLSGKDTRVALIKRMGAQYKIAFTDEEIKRFSIMNSFGVPIASLKEYIKMDDNARTKVKSPGIPLDSINNQLGDWVNFGRIEAARNAQKQKEAAEAAGRSYDYKPLRIAIKADAMANYIAVKQVIDVLKKKDIYSFLLITDLEADNKK